MANQPSLDDLIDNPFWLSLIALRREFHMHPEPGFKEIWTHNRIREVLLRTAGIPECNMRTSAVTGLVVDIKGTAQPRKEASVRCVALRTDMDALTMTEGNPFLPYRSQSDGLAHMCGHDGHMASLIGAAILMQKRADRIPSNFTVRLLFQPAEESTPKGTADYDYAITGGGGAMPLMMDGCLDGVDEVYGYHNWPGWKLGEIAISEGAMMAHAAAFTVNINGKGGHGSAPHLCVDPIVCGAHVVTGIQTIVSRSLPPNAISALTIGQFIGGERNNVIPDKVTMQGTYRDINVEHQEIIEKRLRQVVKSTCESHGCSGDIDIMSQYPVVFNKRHGYEVVKRCANKLEGAASLEVTEQNLPVMAAEDFAFYLQERPGAFFFLGTSEEYLTGLSDYAGKSGKERSNCICHGSSFDFNDNVLPRAVLLFLGIIEDRFSIDLYSQQEVLTGSNLSPDRAKRQRVN